MYTIEKRQLANNLGDGLIEICPEGVVSADNVRIMIIPHATENADGEVIHIGALQAEQIAREFFRGQEFGAIQGRGSVSTFMMESEDLNLDKTVVARAPEDMTMPDWHAYIDMFKPGRKALFNLDLLIDTLQRLKKSSGEKNLCVELDLGETPLSKMTLMFKNDFENMPPLPYAYVLQCTRNEDAEDDEE